MCEGMRIHYSDFHLLRSEHRMLTHIKMRKVAIYSLSLPPSFPFLFLLGVESGALHLQDKCSTVEIHPSLGSAFTKERRYISICHI